VHIHCVLSLISISFCVVVFCCKFMCVSCFGLVVSTCQVIGWIDSCDDTFMWWDYLHKPQLEEIVCMYFLFRLVCLMRFLPALHNMYFIRLWHARYSLFVLKLPLNTNKPNKTKPLQRCQSTELCPTKTVHLLHCTGPFSIYRLHAFLHSSCVCHIRQVSQYNSSLSVVMRWSPGHVAGGYVLYICEK